MLGPVSLVIICYDQRACQALFRFLHRRCLEEELTVSLGDIPLAIRRNVWFMHDYALPLSVFGVQAIF